jgi:hypothetical protein
MEISLYFQIIPRGQRIILLFALNSVLAVTYFVNFQHRIVASFSRVTPNAALIGRPEVLYSLNTLGGQSEVPVYAVVMNSVLIFADVLALQPSEVKDYAYAYETLAGQNSSVMEFMVTGPNLPLVARLANATILCMYQSRCLDVYSLTKSNIT